MPVTAVVAKETEFLPGYTTTERIGAGGYGEVWRAEAPGGFEKAIKVVYGFHDDERATRELKALERIKRVRHPFLLSIERAEIVDGRLAILTELADMSLDQRFEECRQNGLTGIPRDELLGYMRDAADALDFLIQQHKLQHLDVKPENLLLVAGHIKVADFGLVKHISERTQQSLVGGMTPTYAAPEIFDGRPAQNSDQYSLAIVYQEMLTGALPFPGRTSAQLALQHTQSRPMLTPLPEHDRHVVARALAKKPVERFGSCSEFVAALMGSQPRTPHEPRLDSGGQQAEADGLESTIDTQAIASSVTECVAPSGRPKSEPVAAGARHMRTEAIGEGRDSSPLPPPAKPVPEELLPLALSTAVTDAPLPDAASAAAGFRPTLFVAIGGVGARVLASLRHRLTNDERGIDWSAVLPMLLFDTDRATIQAAQNGGLGAEFSRHEVCHLPLRRPQQYRAESPQLLNWLSRRWLYNIPRSLQTRGIRPLGRLALIDHSSRVLDTLEEGLKDLANSARIDEAAQSSGVPVRSGPPRVVVLASTDGGTGGGTAVDVAYAIRSLTSRTPAPQSHGPTVPRSHGPTVPPTPAIEVLGLLLHSTGRKQDQNELALANTYAVLSELSTIHRTGYRGARPPEARSACFEGEGRPFDHLYYVHLGDDLSEEQFTESIENVADYLHWDAVSCVGAMLDACRPTLDSAEDAGAEHLENSQDEILRSFSLTRLQLAEGQPAVQAVHPRAAQSSGHTRRLMLLAPPKHALARNPSALHSQRPPITVLPANVLEPVLLYEAERLSLAHVAANLIDGRPDIVEAANRLHARNDIQWQNPPAITTDTAATTAAVATTDDDSNRTSLATQVVN